MSAEPQLRVVDAGGVPMSGRLAAVDHPRAVIVALHGGGTTSAYFDCPGHPRLSLLRLGAAAGFSVLALDRPGYGMSAGYEEAMAQPEQRVELAYQGVAAMLGSRPRGAGVFVLGHSNGCELALRMAADPRGADLLGVEIAGTGTRPHPVVENLIATAHTGERPRGLAELLWRPEHLYPAGIAGRGAVVSPGAHYEGAQVKNWPTHDFPDLAARVGVPVQFSWGDHDAVWQSDPGALAEIAAMFTAAPRVHITSQVDGGHNLSLGRTAGAYHLKVLSFVEECIAVRESVEIKPDLEAG